MPPPEENGMPLSEKPPGNLPDVRQKKIAEKLNTIVIPDFRVREALISDVAPYLSEESKSFDPEGVGVSILLQADVQSDQTVTIALRYTPLIDVLKYVTQAAGLKYQIMSSAVLITKNAGSSNQQAEPPSAEDEKRKQTLTQKLNTIVMPDIRYREARLDDIALHLAEESRRVDSEKIGVNVIIASGVPLDKPPITLSLDKPTLNEALQNVTKLAGLKFRVEPSAVVIYWQAPTTIKVDGDTYEEIRWGEVTPTTVKIFHRSGVASIPLEKLPPDLRQKLGYDSDKANAERKRQQDAARRAQEQAQRSYWSSFVRTSAAELTAGLNRADRFVLTGKIVSMTERTVSGLIPYSYVDVTIQDTNGNFVHDILVEKEVGATEAATTVLKFYENREVADFYLTRIDHWASKGGWRDSKYLLKRVGSGE